MARSDDQAYYELRAIEEIELGERAPEAIVAAVHYEMACRYGILSAQSVAGAPPSTPTEGWNVSSPSEIAHVALNAA